MEGLLEHLNHSGLSNALRDAVWGQAALLSLHLLGMTLLLGVPEAAKLFLPVAWGGFALALCSGALLFVMFPVDYARNAAFQVKLLLVLAGLNVLVFSLGNRRKSNAGEGVPPAAKVSAGLSLLLWLGVLLVGRFIGFM